jgi:deazaflavin-dependent oxidoreductase (nitroreductase family)
VVEFRANGGKTFGIFRDQPLLLLTTTGAKSGEPRTTPLVYTRDGDHLVIVASNGGAPSHPSWFLNVLAHPEVTVEVGSERLTMRAAVAEGEARDRLYARQAAAMPAFTAYQAKTERRIPIVVLEKVE